MTNSNEFNADAAVAQLMSLLGAFASASSEVGSTAAAPVDLEVEEAPAPSQEVEVLLQGSRKTPTRSFVASMVGDGSTFEDLRSRIFQASSTTQVSGVAVTLDGHTTTYSATDRIPGSVLDANQVRISYSVNSGTNGAQ